MRPRPSSRSFVPGDAVATCRSLPRRGGSRALSLSLIAALAATACDGGAGSSPLPRTAPIAPKATTPEDGREDTQALKAGSHLAIPHGTRLVVEPSASSWGFELELDPSPAGELGEIPPGTNPELAEMAIAQAKLNAEFEAGGGRVEPPSRAVFEVRGERDGWVEIETLPTHPPALPRPSGDTPPSVAAEPSECAPRAPGLEPLRLRFFVRRSELDDSAVLAKPLAELYPCDAVEDVPPDEVEEVAVAPLQWGMREDYGAHDEEWELAEGTKVHWPDGALAGRVMSTHRYLSQPTPQGERSCVELQVGAARKASLQICADAAAFIERDPPRRTASIDAELLEVLDEAGVLGDFSDAELEALFGAGGILADPPPSMFGAGAELDSAFGVGGLGLGEMEGAGAIGSLGGGGGGGGVFGGGGLGGGGSLNELVDEEELDADLAEALRALEVEANRDGGTVVDGGSVDE